MTAAENPDDAPDAWADHSDDDDFAPFIRKIIHVDMDAFFASVEQRDDPELRGKSVAVGGGGKRGVVAAASYEARKFGVRSAMSGTLARQKCPDLIFVPPRFDAYRAISHQIRAIFQEYADEVEPLSLDEAYLDVSRDKMGIGSATATARIIRRRIFDETGLTASAGVSYNKFIAKLASDQNKPDGLTTIPPGRGAAFVQALPLRRFHGIGPVTARKMEDLGLLVGADLAAKPIEWLVQHFGNSADWLFHLARGIDHRRVKSDRPMKSLGGERTFPHDLHHDASIREALEHVCDIVWKRAEKAGAKGRTISLKMRYGDFQTITRAKTLASPIAAGPSLLAVGMEILDPLLPVERGIRLIGITLSKFDDGAKHRTKKEEEADRLPPPRDLFSLL